MESAHRRNSRHASHEDSTGGFGPLQKFWILRSRRNRLTTATRAAAQKAAGGQDDENENDGLVEEPVEVESTGRRWGGSGVSRSITSREGFGRRFSVKVGAAETACSVSGFYRRGKNAGVARYADREPVGGRGFGRVSKNRILAQKSKIRSEAVHPPQGMNRLFASGHSTLPAGNLSSAMNECAIDSRSPHQNQAIGKRSTAFALNSGVAIQQRAEARQNRTAIVLKSLQSPILRSTALKSVDAVSEGVNDEIAWSPARKCGDGIHASRGIEEKGVENADMARGRAASSTRTMSRTSCR